MFFRITCLLKVYVVKVVMNCRKKCLVQGHVLVCDLFICLTLVPQRLTGTYVLYVLVCDVVLQFCFDA